MHDKTNANVTDEIASRQIVQNMQDAQSTNNDELFASASAQEHDYIAFNDKWYPLAPRSQRRQSERCMRHKQSATLRLLPSSA